MKSITERHVQAIWYDAALRPSLLFTRSGEEVRIVSPGEWNRVAGPDFHDAVLEVGPERRRIVGDVEVHLCPSDWDLHNHGTDPHYRNVIAHVTWEDGPEPRTLPRDALSIWLGHYMSTNPAFAPEQIDLTAYPYARLSEDERPCETALKKDPERAKTILSRAGRRRIGLKAQRIRGLLCERHGQRRQVFYEEVMSALGYTNNATQFRHVAERVPLNDLPQDPEVARSAILVAAEFESWKASGRPNNNPKRRLANAAALFTTTPVMELASETDFSQSSCRKMMNVLCGEHLVGKGRAAALLANVILPFALAEGRVAEVPDWLPPEDISYPVRLTALRMFGRDHSPSAHYAKNDLLVQGLIQIRHDLCQKLHPDCQTCPAGEKVVSLV